MKVFDMILKEEKTVIDNVVIGTKHKFTYSDGMVVERYFNDYEVIDNSKYEVREYYGISDDGELKYDVLIVKPSYEKAYEKVKYLMELEDDTELCYPSIPEKTRDEFIKKMLKKGKQIITIIHLSNTKPNDNLTVEQRIMLNKIEHIDWRKANIEDVTKVYEIIKNYQEGVKMEELIKNIEECEYECLAGNLKQNINWIELKEKASKIDEIIWSWRHGNFASYEEVIKEIDDLFD